MTWFTWRTNATRRKATASRGDNRPSRSTQRLVASPILSIFYDAPQPAGGAYRRARECEGGGREGGGPTSGANECARGRWYFQFHRAWVNEAHEGWREVRAATLRNFPTRRQNWRRRRASASAFVPGAPL